MALLNPKKITNIQCTLWSPEEIKKFSVVEISNPDLYENNKPKAYGLFDPRLGADRNFYCSTCKSDIKTCSGHFGRITLSKKCYVPHFMGNVIKVLQSVCHVCSKLLIPEYELVKLKNTIQNKKRNNKLKFIAKESTKYTYCSNVSISCYAVQPKYKKDGTEILASFANDKKIRIYAEDCYNLFKMISDDTCQLLGFDCEYSRPEYMIVSILPVLPPSSRPSVFHNSNQRSECDLTHKYLDILKCNNALKQKLEKIEQELNDLSKNKEREINETIDIIDYKCSCICNCECQKNCKDSCICDCIGQCGLVCECPCENEDCDADEDEDCECIKTPETCNSNCFENCQCECMGCENKCVCCTRLCKNTEQCKCKEQEAKLLVESKYLERKKKHDDTVEQMYKHLQYHVWTLMNNKSPGIPPSQQRSGRVLQALQQKISGKTGRVRCNLSGKRVDFSSRSVITPDPNISIDELGVPMKVAKVLTYPETVNKFNIEKLTNLLKNDAYPTVIYITKKGSKSCSKVSIIKKQISNYEKTEVPSDMQKLLYKTHKNIINLEEGDKIERQLMDGDYVIFNRQPSLHKMSMMGHKVKVLIYDTFRLNPCVVTPYNADQFSS